jgi:hypothetical protein
VTFGFAAEYVEPQATYSFPIGLKATGHYTFELNTPGSSLGPNSFTTYGGAIKHISVSLTGYGAGTGMGSSGDILLGDPVQTGGSFNFLSDQYYVYTGASGLSVPSPFGERHLLEAIIRLADLDQVGLTSTALSAVPPSLEPFLDNVGTTFDTDDAELWLTFDFPGGGRNTAAFRLTSLFLVPEPGGFVTAWLAAASTCIWRRHRRAFRN